LRGGVLTISTKKNEVVTKTLSSFDENINKYIDFVSWSRWNPDLFFDLITPELGGIRLDLDQRVFLRSMSRFISTYGVFPRGYGKTFIECLSMYHTAIFFPDIELTMSAQTKENASELLQAKHREITKFYPLLKDEIVKSQFSRNDAFIEFTSGGTIDVLANHTNSKGQRRKRINIEEAALLNDFLYQEVLEPIPNVPRRTIGKKACIDPEELNGMINFFTTSGYKNSDAFTRCQKMVNAMTNLEGVIVLGASWELGVNYNRGETKSKIMAKKETNSPIHFAQNYCSRWVGSTSGALLNISNLMARRILPTAELKGKKDFEYVICMDIARSDKDSNNKSSIGVLKIIKKNNDIANIDLVFLKNLSNGLNFEGQTIELKRIAKKYNTIAVVIDANGIGKGVLEECLKEHIDPLTGDLLPAWNTINTEDESEIETAPKMVFALVSTGINSDIIVNFVNMVESQKLRLLEKRQNVNYELEDLAFYEEHVAPYLETDEFIDEVANLKLVETKNKKLTVEQVIKSVDKDRYSAVAYGLYYIKNHYEVFDDDDYSFCFMYA